MNCVEPSISFDEMLDALSDIQRRSLLLALLEENTQTDAPVAFDTSDNQAAVERSIRMQHIHLPKLKEYGLITWDQDTHEVTKGPTFEEIDSLLRLLDENSDKLPDTWALQH